MTTIPKDVNDAWDDLLKKGLSSDDYTYLVFDVKKTETDPTKKVQVFVKVYVPDSLRKTATTNVAEAMKKEGYYVEQKTNKTNNKLAEIDIQASTIGDKPQVIRVQFKPISGGGSGGGSKKTTIQESTSCLYNALRFHVIKKKLTAANVTEAEDMEKAMEFIRTPDVTLEQMINFANQDPDWKEVFMDGANKLYDKVQSHSKTKTDYIFVRGDEKYDDGLIKEAFKQCKSSLIHKELKNEDKWNPSDIWMYSKGAETKIVNALEPYGDKQSKGTVELLNEELKKLFNDGILMGVSLKKTGASGSVKIMNNDTPEKRRRELGYNFKKDISLNSLVYDNKIKYSGPNAFKQWPMDVYIQYGTAEKEHIQLRNFGGKDTGDWKLEIKGVYANMGKVQGNVARFILGQTGFKNIPQEADFEKCDPKDSNKTHGKEITEEIYTLLKRYKARNFNTTDKAKPQMMGDIASKRQSWRYSKLSGLRFLDYLCQPGVDADKAVKELVLFGGSQSDHSSIYYKYS